MCCTGLILKKFLMDVVVCRFFFIQGDGQCNVGNGISLLLVWLS